MTYETYNFDENVKQLFLAALNTFKHAHTVASKMGVTRQTLCNWKKRYDIKYDTVTKKWIDAPGKNKENS